MGEMTLQEAIDHAREVANGLRPNIDGCSECAKQHGQLADWLEELQKFKSIGTTPDDVQPLVHGRWERLNWGFDYDRCSVCGYEHRWPGPFYYCPKCGAYMREE